MSIRHRRPQRIGIRTRLGHLVEGDERQQLLVTGFFIVAIVAVILILVGAVALAWYNDNLRPLAHVGSVEIGPQILKDSVRLEGWRIARDESRITQAQIDGTLDANTAQLRLSALDQRTQDLSTTALDDLVDEVYQSQLAADEGISVSDADVNARIEDEVAAQEQRHILAVVVEPQMADATAGPSVTESRAALSEAQKALADIQAGRDWAEVAKQYGTDDKSKSGGDLGLLTQTSVADEGFGARLFELEVGGTTEIVRGDDGAYRIGKVTEIVPAGEEPGLRSGLDKAVSDQSLRDLLRYQIAAERLSDKITQEALQATPEQVRLAVIYIAGLYSGDTGATSEGEIDYSEIVFAPNDNLDTAPDLAADDPAWDTAKADADRTLADLKSVTDVEAMKTRFGQLASELSDDATSADDGSVGFVTRDIPPTAVADALFDGTWQENDLIGPIRGDAGYYVLLFHERRASAEDRVKAVQDALAQPGADFNAIAKELSDGPEKDDGGEIGWLTKDQLGTDIADTIFGLAPGQVSDPLELSGSDGHYIVKVEEKAVRALDADQVPTIRANAFGDWYATRRTEAETNGTITIAGTDLTGGDLIPGTDQGTP